MEIMEIFGDFWNKNLVKFLVLQKKLLISWFDEFFSVKEKLPKCTQKRLILGLLKYRYSPDFNTGFWQKFRESNVFKHWFPQFVSCLSFYSLERITSTFFQCWHRLSVKTFGHRIELDFRVKSFSTRWFICTPPRIHQSDKVREFSYVRSWSDTSQIFGIITKE